MGGTRWRAGGPRGLGLKVVSWWPSLISPFTVSVGWEVGGRTGRGPLPSPVFLFSCVFDFCPAMPFTIVAGVPSPRATVEAARSSAVTLSHKEQSGFLPFSGPDGRREMGRGRATWSCSLLQESLSEFPPSGLPVRGQAGLSLPGPARVLLWATEGAWRGLCSEVGASRTRRCVLRSSCPVGP